jgi:hypothetical protein
MNIYSARFKLFAPPVTLTGDYQTDIDKVFRQLKRGICYCTVCGRTVRIDAHDCLYYGFPVCCGMTMTTDSPDERG